MANAIAPARIIILSFDPASWLLYPKLRLIPSIADPTTLVLMSFLLLAMIMGLNLLPSGSFV
ncbi:MAG: hypothetical protein GT600_11360 [Bacteroidales bacterium]|jgi:hypothetical protein|nr:hypothetical protein [Bacteroidales bacterium]